MGFNEFGCGRFLPGFAVQPTLKARNDEVHGLATAPLLLKTRNDEVHDLSQKTLSPQYFYFN
jgi:hypothetical protein